MPAVLDAPKPTLTQVEHFDRCYRALGATYGADTEKRTRAAFDQYRKENPADELDQIAAEKFPDNEFITVRDVPIFAEHTTTDSRGKKVRYGKDELAGIVQRCNERILDTGDFAPLSDGHTPTQDMIKTGAKMPDVLGYCGPFRLGIIGRKKPRYAIFADEHYHKADVDKVRRLPRRSPEVWLEERLEDRILDPIAALGAETPRLDLGMARFRRAGDDREVERYSAVAAFPSGMNTSLPNDGSDKRHYDAASSGESSMLQPEDVQSIVQAIQATKQWQFLSELMEQQGGGPGEPDGDEIPAADPGMPPSEQAAGPGMGPVAPSAPSPSPAPAAPTPAAAPTVPDETADMDDSEKQSYAALCPNGKAGYMAARKRWKPSMTPASMPQREAYSKLAAERDAAAAEASKATDRAAELQKQVDALEKKNRDTERYSKLRELSREYAFELDSEFSEVRELDDDAWQRHLRAVSRYAKRNDPTAVDYLPVDPPEPPPAREANREDIERRYHRAGEIANERQRRGEFITAEEALAEALKEEQ